MIQKCKECNIEKELSWYYKHPEWLNWVLGRCKDCIKLGRKSEKEKIMARIRDKDRYYNNKKRRDYCFNRSSQWAKDNPIKRRAQSSVARYYSKHERPIICCHCSIVWPVDMHHEDHSLPNIVYPLCRMCHNNRHAGNIELLKIWELTLHF